MAEPVIRFARSADADEMAETAIAAWREGFRGIVPDEVDPRRSWRPERLEERLRTPSIETGEMLVVETAGKVRGLVLFGTSRDAGASSDEGEVIALYVHPDHWRAGFGRRLVEGGLDRMAAAGLGQAIVWTLAESPRNIAFYESLGFRHDGGTQRRESFGSPLEVRFRMSL